MNRKQTGDIGEDRAAAYLVAQGYRIIDRNARTRFGEIDIVAGKDGVTVFVEVKRKRSNLFGLPEEMVGARKQRKLARLAQVYMGDQKVAGPVRLDVIAIDGNGLRHHQNAF